jgi:hypothetical protein
MNLSDRRARGRSTRTDERAAINREIYGSIWKRQLREVTDPQIAGEPILLEPRLRLFDRAG